MLKCWLSEEVVDQYGVIVFYDDGVGYGEILQGSFGILFQCILDFYVMFVGGGILGVDELFCLSDLKVIELFGGDFLSGRYFEVVWV